MRRTVLVWVGLFLLLGAGMASAGTLHVADLDGTQEVPPSGSTGTGHANIYLSADGTNLHIKLTASGLSSAITASHFHLGAAGMNGGVVFNIGAFSGSIEKDFTVTPANVADLNAGMYYVNVHTASFPNGEIRGQVGLGTSSSFLGNMDGSQEVPPSGSAGTGVADVTLHGDGSNLHVELTAMNLSSAISASHIHLAPAGQNGVVVFNIGAFTPPARISKDFTPTPTQIADLQAGNHYANVHTANFPNGEIRGQLAAQVSGVGPLANAPGSLLLMAAPNPVRSGTVLAYRRNTRADAHLEIFDASGRSVRVLPVVSSGQTVWDGKRASGDAAPGGVYFARLSVGRESRTIRLDVVR